MRVREAKRENRLQVSNGRWIQPKLPIGLNG